MDTSIPITIHPLVADGHEPTSTYVEAFWLPVLGPTATWMWRRLASVAAHAGGPVAFDIEELAAQIGVRPQVVRHSIERLVRFELAHQWSKVTFAVYTRAPRLKQGQIRHLTPGLQELHARVEDEAVPA